MRSTFLCKFTLSSLVNPNSHFELFRCETNSNLSQKRKSTRHKSALKRKSHNLSFFHAFHQDFLCNVSNSFYTVGSTICTKSKNFTLN